MIGLITAGGFGTRLGGVPKGLIRIDGKTLVEHIYNKMEDLYLEDIYLTTNLVHAKEYWKLAQKLGIKMVIEPSSSNEDKLGSVGGLKFFSDIVPWDDIVVVACDNYFNFGFRELTRYENAVVLYDVEGTNKDLSKYGQAIIDEDNRVIGFYEKPRTVKSTLISTGIYRFNEKVYKELYKYYDEGYPLDRFGDFIKWLINKVELYGVVYNAKRGWVWYDVGSLDELEEAGGKI